MKNGKLSSHGKFFTKGNPKAKWYGNLIIEDNIIRLESIDNHFESAIGGILSPNNKKETVIIGDTSEGSVALIGNGTIENVRLNFISETRERFYMALLSQEEDLSVNKNLEFKEISLNIVRLKDFIAKGNLIQSLTFDKKKRVKRIQITAKLTRKPYFKFRTSNYLFYFDLNHQFSLTNNDNIIANEFPLKEFVSLRIKKIKGKFNYKEILNLIYKTRNFFALSVRDPIYFHSLSMRNYADKKTRQQYGSKYLSTKLYLSEREFEEIKKPNQHKYSFKLDDIQNNISNLYEKWIDLEKDYPVLYNNYFAYLYDNKTSWESIFLKLVIGIEEYYKINRKTLEKIDVVEIKDKRRSSPKRMQQIKELLPNQLKNSISDDDICSIMDIRDHIAHNSVPQTIINAMKEQNLIRKLIQINETLIMMVVGFEDDIIEKSMDRYKLI